MGMTREERATREALADKLAEQGYVTYSELFSLFDLNITYDPTTVGYMIPNKGTIVINGTLKPQTMLLIIRHEIMHEYLTHEMRLIKHVAEKHGLDPDELDDVSIEDIKNEIYKDINFNIAGDYEISNRAYTEQDKQDIRNLELNGQIVSGLVTEDKYPDWVDLPLEDMYDNLIDELNKQKDQIEDQAEKDQEQVGNSQSDGEGEGGQSQSDNGQGQQGNQSGNNDSQDSDQEDGDSDNQSDNQGNKSSDSDDQDDQSSDSDSQDGQSNQQQDNKSNQSQDNQSGNQSGDQQGQKSGSQSDQQSNQDNQSGQQSGNQSDNKSQDSQDSNGNQQNNNQQSKSEPIKVVHGTFRNGHFYDRDGNEIIPEV